MVSNCIIKKLIRNSGELFYYSLLRGHCKTICEVHGLIWVLRQLFEQKIHPVAEIQKVAQELLTGNLHFANNAKTKVALEELVLLL